MFKNTYQSGFLSVMYSVGSQPLALWEKKVKNGHIRRLTDEDLRSLVIEIMGTNVATTYVTCPMNPRESLGIRLPFLIMIVKNMKKYFSFEIQILDDKNMHRRFRISNFQSSTTVRPFCTSMPICLSPGWNQIQFNLSDFTKRAYGTNYLETTRIQIHANVRIRRIYFSDRLYTEDEMPQEFKLFLPFASTPPRKASIRVSKPGKEDKSKTVELKEPPAPSEVDANKGDLTVPTAISLAEEQEEHEEISAPIGEISITETELAPLDELIESVPELTFDLVPESVGEEATNLQPESIAEASVKSEAESISKTHNIEEEEEGSVVRSTEEEAQSIIESETEAESVTN